MAVSQTTEAHAEAPVRTGFWALTLGSIGVVFGDIGTSPLYAFREAVDGAAHGAPVTRVIVLGSRVGIEGHGPGYAFLHI
jgi:KUP system potassium uptake protein